MLFNFVLFGFFVFGLFVIGFALSGAGSRDRSHEPHPRLPGHVIQEQLEQRKKAENAEG